MLQNTTPNQDFIAPSETVPQSSSSTNLPIADLSDGMANLQLSSLKSFPNISPKLENTPLSTTAKSTQDEKIPTPLLKGSKTFVQRSQQQTPSYQYPKKSTPSPIYNYFAEGQKYLSSHQNEEGDNEGTFNFVKKTSMSPKKPSQDKVQTPNYRDFDFFNGTNSPDKGNSPGKLNHMLLNMNINQKSKFGSMNIEDFQQGNNKKMNILNKNITKEDFKPNMQMNMGENDNEEEEDEDNELDNQLNNNFRNIGMKPQFNQKQFDFGNFRPNNNMNEPNSDFNPFMMNNPPNQAMPQGMNMGNLGMGQNQKMPMFPFFGNEGLMQQQQPMNIGKLNKEDYLFEKFGKRGWQCIQCNNFNFETRNKCNKCGLPMAPKLINKNRRDDYFNPDEKKKKPLIERKGDWLCPKCRNLNFAFRLICNRCQLPKSDAGGSLPFPQGGNPKGNFSGGMGQPNFNFPSGGPNSMMGGNAGNINIYNNYYNYNNKGKNVGNPNMLSYMGKINSQQKGMSEGNSSGIGNYSQFSNFEQKSIQSNINNGPQSMSPGNYGLGMNMNSQNFDLNSNLHHDEIDNDEEEGSSGDEEENGRKF